METKPGRPFGVTVIVIVQLIAVIMYGSAAGSVFMMGQPDQLGLITGSELYLATSLSLELFSLVLVAGLWRQRRWAWVLFMVRLGLDMAIDLISFANGEPHYFSMLLNVLMVFYLNQTDVQRAFAYPRTDRKDARIL